MSHNCDGCSANESCIIQFAIKRNDFKEKCPCIECLVKMICDHECDPIIKIVQEIPFSINDYEIFYFKGDPKC